MNLKPPPLLHLSQTGLLKGPEFILGPPLVPVLVADRPSGEVRPLYVADGAEVLLLFRGLKGGRIIEGVPLLSTCKPMPKKKNLNDISDSNINVNIKSVKRTNCLLSYQKSILSYLTTYAWDLHRKNLIIFKLFLKAFYY